MAGIDDNVAIIGDWVPPLSPSPRAFFSGVVGDTGGSKTAQETAGDNCAGGIFLDSKQHMITENKEECNVAANGVKFTGAFSEQKSGSGGGLVERMAARAGFNAPRLNTESIRSGELSLNPEIRSPYLTIPPGLSPTSLLDSPVFLSNSLAQPSPTTGQFSFAPHNHSNSSALVSEPTDKSKNSIDNFSSSSFAFKPVADSGSSVFLVAANKVTPATFAQAFPSVEVSVQSENGLQFQNRNIHQLSMDLSRSTAEKDSGRGSTIGTEKRTFDSACGSAENSPPLDEQQGEGEDQRVSGESMVVGGGTPSEDVYNWRKYGQKQVKGSEYPRSYYKCTHPSCSVKKKVERSLEGHITEIVYKGVHNHPKPPLNRRSAIGNPLMDMQLDVPDRNAPQSCTDNDLVLANAPKGTADWRQDNVEVTSSASVTPELGNLVSAHPQTGNNHFESVEPVDVSSTFSNDDDEDDQATHGSVGDDGEGDESESKRRKIETYAVADMAGATRAIREPRVVVQTTSEVDILDDGYRWRKYGQKVVKGNPNPRSYYKCTNAGCTVRKHVERASHDLKSVITTYEGKHNHDVPAARNSSHLNTGNSNTASTQASVSVQTHLQRPEPSRIHNNMPRYDRSAAFGSFGMPGRQQLGPSAGFSFGTNQPGFANLAMAGFGPGQHKMHLMPVHPFLAQQRSMSEMGMMLPKGEAKMEAISEHNLNLPNNPSVYQQFMSSLPLGPPM